MKIRYSMQNGKIEEELKKKIKIIENEKEIRNLYEEIKKEKEKGKERIIERLKGIKRTTGQHPGGLLITLPNTKISNYTPLNYPANNKKMEWVTTHFEYSFLSKMFFKLDVLGNDEITILKKLFQTTGINPLEIPFHDEKIMKIFTNADTLGIPEFGTDFVRKNLLTLLKPKKFSHLIQISGFSHGTDVWINNQQIIYKNRELELDELIACREDIWKFLISQGIREKEAFIATEFIKKGDWGNLPINIKKEIEEKLNISEKGKIYLSILNKIKYIFPKPHAIAYTMVAWRIAYYKVYCAQEFYSSLLTYHSVVYDIWLMTFNHEVVDFYLKNLLVNPQNYKNSDKELFSIIRVLEKLEKENKKKNIEEKNNVIRIVLENIKKEINNSNNEKIKNNFRLFSKIWKMTAKEKDLYFTLKVIWEMREREVFFTHGIDLNKSESEYFKIEDKKIFFPIMSISGFGKKTAEKIIKVRDEGLKITKNWREELKSVLNINHLEQLSNLEKYNLLINL